MGMSCLVLTTRAWAAVDGKWEVHNHEPEHEYEYDNAMVDVNRHMSNEMTAKLNPVEAQCGDNNVEWLEPHEQESAAPAWLVKHASASKLSMVSKAASVLLRLLRRERCCN